MIKKCLRTFMIISFSMVLFGCGAKVELEKATNDVNKVEETVENDTEQNVADTVTEPVTEESEVTPEEVPTSTPEPEEMPTSTPEPEPEVQPTATPEPEPTEAPTATPTPEPTETPTPTPEPTEAPTPTPAPEPTKAPTATPEPKPTEAATSTPTPTPTPKTFQYAFEGRYWLEYTEYGYEGRWYDKLVYYYDGVNVDGYYKANEFFRFPYTVVGNELVFDWGSGHELRYQYSLDGNTLTLYSEREDMYRYLTEVKRTDFDSLFTEGIVEDADTHGPGGAAYAFEGVYWVEIDQFGETIGYYYDGTNETTYRGKETSTRFYYVTEFDAIAYPNGENSSLMYYYLVEGDDLFLTPSDGSMIKYCFKVSKEDFEYLMYGDSFLEEEPAVNLPAIDESKTYTYEFEGRYWLEYYPNGNVAGHIFDGTNKIMIYNGEASEQPYTVEDNHIVYNYEWGTMKISYYMGSEDGQNYLTLYPDDGSMEAHYIEVDKAEFEAAVNE